jgi:hypothetical protein
VGIVQESAGTAVEFGVRIPEVGYTFRTSDGKSACVVNIDSHGVDSVSEAFSCVFPADPGGDVCRPASFSRRATASTKRYGIAEDRDFLHSGLGMFLFNNPGI